jgi:hypothetical protein
MVGSSALPANVADFIGAHIATLEQLELLLLLMQAPDRWWDARSASSELGLHPESSRRALDHLAAHNLLAIRVTGDVRYQYQPGEPGLADAARAFAETFRAQRAAVLQLVVRRERRSIRDFAEAFRIRRDDDR